MYNDVHVVKVLQLLHPVTTCALWLEGPIARGHSLKLFKEFLHCATRGHSALRALSPQHHLTPCLSIWIFSSFWVKLDGLIRDRFKETPILSSGALPLLMRVSAWSRRMGACARAAALALVLQQLVLSVAAQGMSKYLMRVILLFFDFFL